ncbi:MAG: MurR/RpiR family transcriptional regulator, partial [Olsenella sp.]|nr:MurR/RpiR family transcriptional regulator [Olsenella sp.]
MGRDQTLRKAIVKAALDAPGSRKAIADFLLLEGSGVAQLTMAQVASATYTSKPTLVRFAKRLGFSGWPEFREAFLAETLAEDERMATGNGVDVNHPFGADASLAEAVGNIVRVQELAIHGIAEKLDEEALIRAAKAIDGARNVVFFARPPSRHFGHHFGFELNSIGKTCCVPHAEEGDLAINVMEKVDCALFASYGGALAKEPLCYVEDVRDKGITVIAVTSKGSALAHSADIALTFDPIERYFDKIAGFYSCACIRQYLDALFVACYQEHYSEYQQEGQERTERLKRVAGMRDDLREQ